MRRPGQRGVEFIGADVPHGAIGSGLSINVYCGGAAGGTIPGRGIVSNVIIVVRGTGAEEQWVRVHRERREYY